MPVESDDELRDLLDLETIAVVGCSSTPGKDAHEIPAYLQEQGYEIIPVNPFSDEVLGQKSYDRLSEVEEDIDIVNVFRPSQELPGISEAVVDRHRDRGDIQGFWLQLGIKNDQAVSRVEAAGITVVQDRCMKVEHQRLKE